MDSLLTGDYMLPVDHAGTSLFVRFWRSPKSSHHPILWLHDFGESSKSIAPGAQALQTRGWNVYGFDRRGHGKSGKQRGHIPNFDTLVQDLLQVSAWIKHTSSGKAPLLIAQGSASTEALSFSQLFENFCEGIILINPVLSVKNPMEPWVRSMIRMLAQISPKFRLPLKITSKYYFLAPRVTATLTNELLAAIENSEANISETTRPTLFMIPDHDDTSDYHPLKKLVALHDRENLTLKSLPFSPRHLHSITPTQITQISELILSFFQKLEAPLNSPVSGAKRSEPDGVLLPSNPEIERIGASKH